MRLQNYSKQHTRYFTPKAAPVNKSGANLAQALAGAAWVHQRVCGYGVAAQSLNTAYASLSQSLSNAATHNPLRGAIQDLAFLAQRQRGRAQALIQALALNPTKTEPSVLALLEVALAIMVKDGVAKYDAHTVVNQAVVAVARVLHCANMSWHAHPVPDAPTQVKGFVNGVLRRWLREQDALLATALQNPVAQWNYPQWWITAVQKDYPEAWQSILQAGNAQAAMTLRVNQRVGSLAEAQHALEDAGIASDTLLGSATALRLQRPTDVARIPGFMEGFFSVQDEGAQRLLQHLDLQPGQRVLDACAAPGGKAALMLEACDIHLTAVDIDQSRLDKIAQTFQRVRYTLPNMKGENKNISLKIVAADMTQSSQTSAWFDGTLFDCIVLDAPCSASGVVRRHPDARWLRRPDDLKTLIATQATLLKSVWPTLAVGGRLVYITCSVFKSEGEAQIAAFLDTFSQDAQNSSAKQLPAQGQLLPYATADTEHDGFYYAVLQKNAEGNI